MIYNVFMNILPVLFTCDNGMSHMYSHLWPNTQYLIVATIIFCKGCTLVKIGY